MEEKNVKFPTGRLLDLLFVLAIFIVSGSFIFLNSEYQYYEDLVHTVVEATFGISSIMLIYVSVMFFKAIREWQYAKSAIS